MGRIQVVIPDELEHKLRKECLHKGDMSELVTRALTQYLR